MVSIGSRPILWHIMKYYAQFGFEFVLALRLQGEMIKNYFCHYEVMNNDVTVELGRPENLRIEQLHGEAGWKITWPTPGKNPEGGHG